MEVIGELAGIYGLDRVQAMTAGLLHDAAKDLQPEQMLALAREGGIQFSHPCERLPVYLHAPVGAYWVSRELGITDVLVLDAIATHSYVGDGPGLDRTFAWCLRSADILVPMHKWHGMKKLKSVVYAGRLEEAALLQCHWLIEYLQGLSVPVHPNFVQCSELLASKLGVDESFFVRW